MASIHIRARAAPATEESVTQAETPMTKLGLSGASTFSVGIYFRETFHYVRVYVEASILGSYTLGGRGRLTFHYVRVYVEASILGSYTLGGRGRLADCCGEIHPAQRRATVQGRTRAVRQLWRRAPRAQGCLHRALALRRGAPGAMLPPVWCASHVVGEKPSQAA
eukprot:scaffold91423_cov60-Phaeocystis_antarctica.AAC.1